MKKEKRFKGIQSKIILYFVALFLFISIITGFIQHRVNTNIQFEGIRNDATQLAIAASLLVDGNQHDILANEQNENSEAYEEIRTALREFKDETGVSGVYTLAQNNENSVQFIIDADDDPIEIGYQYDYLPEMQKAFAGTPTAEEEITTDEWGAVLSGYTAITDSQGETVGIVGVDIDASRIAQIRTQQFKILSIGTVLGATTMLLLSIFISRRITQPINTLDQLFEELSSAGGDLTKKIEIKTGDEIESLAKSINKFIENIRGIIVQVKDTGEDVATSADSLNISIHENQKALEEVNTAIENIAAGASEQAEDVTDISSGIQDITVVMRGNQNRVGDINNAAGETRKLIDEGLIAVKNQSIKTDENMEAFQQVTTVVEKLLTEIKEIEYILSTITDISEQTNLLALNAAIEAARAGEHGRGFSVVAEEVRTLAENSASSTEEISQILSNINQGVSEVVQQIDEASLIAQEQKDAVDSTSSTFDNITQEVENVINAIDIISASFQGMGEQTIALSDKTQDVSAVSEENAAMTEEVSASSEQQSAAMYEMGATAEQLSNLSGNLEQLIASFKI